VYLRTRGSGSAPVGYERGGRESGISTFARVVDFAWPLKYAMAYQIR
jgi:hypothetical protein